MNISVPQNGLTPEYILSLFKDVAQRFKDTDKQFQDAYKQLQETKKLLTEKFQETDRKFQDTDKKFQDTDKKFQDTDKKFQDTDKKFQDTDKKFQDTDKKFQDTDKKFQELHNELGGIGKSNGEIAEDFFYTALEHKMKVANLQFDYIDRNLHRKRNNTEAEYDIILYNAYKVMVVEVKYNFRIHHLHNLYKNGLKRFRTLFPEYKEYKLYGTIAALTYEKDVIDEAKKYGIYVLGQDNDKIKLLNNNDFVPNNIK